ncbi:hypothetical protein ACJ72_04513 [Emergomyces africanus]|uniref:Uncharacterized protein n=1 Tax=Emergomyces africanus TaxID=1955775 RepID=A0A1B7NWK4_9EURO|nr:hypothetical protein ACJ72_04513 [Emergomyces africanus]
MIVLTINLLRSDSKIALPLKKQSTSSAMGHHGPSFSIFILLPIIGSLRRIERVALNPVMLSSARNILHWINVSRPETESSNDFEDEMSDHQGSSQQGQTSGEARMVLKIEELERQLNSLRMVEMRLL